jgi:organic radical activating enzyme
MSEMSASAALNIIEEAQKSLFAAVVVTGGEPLVHHEIDAMLGGNQANRVEGYAADSVARRWAFPYPMRF